MPLVLMALWNASAFATVDQSTQQNQSQALAEEPQASNNQQPITVSGTWIITFSAPPRRTRTLVIQQNDRDVVGTWDAPVCPCSISGSFKGDKLELTITPRHPAGAHSIILTGKVTGDSINGKTHIEGGPGGSSGFTAVRQKTTGPGAAVVTN